MYKNAYRQSTHTHKANIKIQKDKNTIMYATIITIKVNFLKTYQTTGYYSNKPNSQINICPYACFIV